MAMRLPELPEVERLSPVVIRILGGNPGTNTYLVGKGAFRILIDTGQGKSSWSRLLSSLLTSEDASISHALITHWHPDHVGGIKDLVAICPDVLIHKYNLPDRPNPNIKKFIIHRETFEVNGATLRAFHCPGHTADHMSFILLEEDAMFTGDNVLGHGTAVFEDLAAYLDSLARMREQFEGRAYPGHGSVITNGSRKIDEYIAHRQEREGEILQALRGVDCEETTPMELVKVVYKDVPENLHEPAANGVVQVLRKLESEGKVGLSRDGKWRRAAL